VKTDRARLIAAILFVASWLLFASQGLWPSYLTLVAAIGLAIASLTIEIIP
jgi:hypothetical protein